MAADYSDYQPLILLNPTLDDLQSDDYRAFIHAAAIEPGVRLLLHRHRQRPGFPYLNTKFNPNTGEDLPEDRFGILYSWVLGRGTESLAEHLEVLDQLDGLSAAERSEARSVFETWIGRMSRAMEEMPSLNEGRFPFRVNLALRSCDIDGRPSAPDPSIRSAGDLFCAKGLMAGGTPQRVEAGFKHAMEICDFIRRNAIASEQVADRRSVIGQGARMLVMGAVALLARKSTHPAQRRSMFDVGQEFMRFVLDRHYDAATANFSENIDAASGERLPLLDPGHCNEFVGLGLAAIEAMEEEPGGSAAQRQLFSRAKEQMPRMLIRSTELGWNARRQGLHKNVDHATGAVLNDDLPWWNLPETMRAAARCLKITRDETVRARLLQIYGDAHNAYVANYLNREYHLFPFQTRSGATGQVVNKVPAIPEGDPLYHTNLSLLDALRAIGTIDR